jgi:protein gp37
MNKTKISWATHSNNVVHGCHKPAAVPLEVMDRYVDYEVHQKWHKPGSSPECVFCYADENSNKKAASSLKRYGHTKGWTTEPWTLANAAENVTLHPERIRAFGSSTLEKPDPRLPPSQRERIFVCSMGDIFHELVPDSFLRQMWPWLLKFPHIYMLLTKRPERAAEWKGPWPENIWLGATCGHSISRWRLNALRASKAKVRFVSAEPLLEDIAPVIDLTGIHQVIVGGESGDNFRPMEMRWARKLRNLCKRLGVAYYFKQDCSIRPEQRPWLVEKDGRRMRYHQYPGELTPPVLVDAKAAAGDPFPILG